MRRIVRIAVLGLLLGVGSAAAQGTAVYIQEAPEHAGALTRAVHVAIGAHVVAQFADTSTTMWALGTGRFKEANPLMRWGTEQPVRLAIIKGSFAVATSYLLLKMHKQRPKLALVIAGVMTAITSWAAHQNADLLRAERR